MSDTTIRHAARLEGLVARALGRLPRRLQLGLSRRAPLRIDGQTLDSCTQMLLAFSSGRRPGLCEPTPAEARARFRRESAAHSGRRTPVGAVRDFEIEGRAGGRLRVRHYAPARGEARDLLVYLHGGGFVIGDLETHDEPCRLLCRHAATHVLAVEYRLAPEHPFPAGLEDSLAAHAWARANAASLGADASLVSIGGDSAGGNLAAVAARLAAPGGDAPAAQLLIYPATDSATRRPSKELFAGGFFLTREDCEQFYQHYTSGTDVCETDPRVSPLHAEDLRGLPPALVVVAGFDVLRDEGDAYAESLRAAGVVTRHARFPSLAHGFVNMTGLCPSARRAMIRTAKEWRELLDRRGAAL